MTFPNNHALPAELLLWLADGNVFEDQGITDEPVQFERGEDRERPLYTFNPIIVSVAMMCSQEQFDRLVTFYEDELQAGARIFDVRVTKQGGHRTALEWWAAQFVGPPRYEAQHRSHWRVTAELLLRDGPYATRTAPGLRGLASQGHQFIAQTASDTTLRGLATQGNTLLGRPSLPTLRGLALQSNTLLALASEAEALLLESGDGTRFESGSEVRTE
jgi:hypothetical protein